MIYHRQASRSACPGQLGRMLDLVHPDDAEALLVAEVFLSAIRVTPVAHAQVKRLLVAALHAACQHGHVRGGSVVGDQVGVFVEETFQPDVGSGPSARKRSVSAWVGTFDFSTAAVATGCCVAGEQAARVSSRDEVRQDR